MSNFFIYWYWRRLKLISPIAFLTTNPPEHEDSQRSEASFGAPDSSGWLTEGWGGQDFCARKATHNANIVRLRYFFHNAKKILATWNISVSHWSKAAQHVGYITLRAALSFVTHTEQQHGGGSALIKPKLSLLRAANKDWSMLGMISILIAALINPEAWLVLEGK